MTSKTKLNSESVVKGIKNNNRIFMDGATLDFWRRKGKTYFNVGDEISFYSYMIIDYYEEIIRGNFNY